MNLALETQILERNSQSRRSRLTILEGGRLRYVYYLIVSLSRVTISVFECPSTRVESDEEDALRSSLVESFYETLGYCFGKVLLETLGPKVQAAVYDLVVRSGVRKEDIPNRFDDVVQALTSTLGTSSRVVIHRTVVEMFKEYSQRLDFSYTDSLRERLALLKETVVANHVLPRRLREEGTFDSVERPDWSEGNASKGQAYSSLYPMKKGVKT